MDKKLFFIAFVLLFFVNSVFAISFVDGKRLYIYKDNILYAYSGEKLIWKKFVFGDLRLMEDISGDSYKDIIVKSKPIELENSDFYINYPFFIISSEDGSVIKNIKITVNTELGEELYYPEHLEYCNGNIYYLISSNQGAVVYKRSLNSDFADKLFSTQGFMQIIDIKCESSGIYFYKLNDFTNSYYKCNLNGSCIFIGESNKSYKNNFCSSFVEDFKKNKLYYNDTIISNKFKFGKCADEKYYYLEDVYDESSKNHNYKLYVFDKDTGESELLNEVKSNLVLKVYDNLLLSANNSWPFFYNDKKYINEDVFSYEYFDGLFIQKNYPFNYLYNNKKGNLDVLGPSFEIRQISKVKNKYLIFGYDSDAKIFIFDPVNKKITELPTVRDAVLCGDKLYLDILSEDYVKNKVYDLSESKLKNPGEEFIYFCSKNIKIYSDFSENNSGIIVYSKKDNKRLPSFENQFKGYSVYAVDVFADYDKLPYLYIRKYNQDTKQSEFAFYNENFDRLGSFMENKINYGDFIIDFDSSEEKTIVYTKEGKKFIFDSYYENLKKSKCSSGNCLVFVSYNSIGSSKELQVVVVYYDRVKEYFFKIPDYIIGNLDGFFLYNNYLYVRIKDPYNKGFFYFLLYSLDSEGEPFVVSLKPLEFENGQFYLDSEKVESLELEDIIDSFGVYSNTVNVKFNDNYSIKKVNVNYSNRYGFVFFTDKKNISFDLLKGNYTFKVKSFNDKGIIKEDSKKFIISEDSLYKGSFFGWVFVILSFMFLIYMVVRIWKK